MCNEAVARQRLRGALAVEDLDVGEPGRTACGCKRRSVRRPPVRRIAGELVALVELPQRLVLLAGHEHRCRLDHRELAGYPGEPPQCSERVLEVIQDAGEEHDVEDAELVEIDRREVGDARLDRASERFAGDVEAALSRWPVLVLAPNPGVEGDDPGGTLSLGLEREVAVPGADVEDALAAEVGKAQGGEMSPHRIGRLHTRRDHAAPEVDRVVPERNLANALMEPSWAERGWDQPSNSSCDTKPVPATETRRWIAWRAETA